MNKNTVILSGLSIAFFSILAGTIYYIAQAGPVATTYALPNPGGQTRPELRRRPAGPDQPLPPPTTG